MRTRGIERWSMGGREMEQGRESEREEGRERVGEDTQRSESCLYTHKHTYLLFLSCSKL